MTMGNGSLNISCTFMHYCRNNCTSCGNFHVVQVLNFVLCLSPELDIRLPALLVGTG